MSAHVATPDEIVRGGRRFTILSSNPAKRATELWLFLFFLGSMPFQILASKHFFSYAHTNDVYLDTQGVLLGLGAWGGATFFSSRADKEHPFYDSHGFKLGLFLFVWACIGGYLGTGPWYEVLHGHFASNTTFNPNGVPFFMLPMTIAVFGFYTTILGVIFRLVWQGYKALNIKVTPDWVVKAIVFLPIAALMPILETQAAKGATYCFDSAAGEWGLNVLIYGSWHYAGLLFFTNFDERPGQRDAWLSYIIKGFATVGILMFMMQLVTDVIAPHYTTVMHGAVNINDWSSNNCLGPKPLK